MRHRPAAVPILSVLAALIGAAWPAAAPARPFTGRDLAGLDRVSDPNLSPNGATVAFSVRRTDWEHNRGVTSIYVRALAGPEEARRLPASEGGASSPRWSADGRVLFFLSGRTGSSQVWRTDVTGAKAVQVTRLPLDVGAFRMSPDGRTLVVSMAVYPDCPDLACTVDRQRRASGSAPSGRVFDRAFVRHWDAWADGARNHLFALTLGPDGTASGQPVFLTRGFDGDAPSRPFGGDEDFVVSPDGRTVVFSARLAGRTEPWSTNFDLYSAPIDGSAPPRNLTPDNPAWDAQPVFSPDGTRLAWRAMRRPGFEADRYAIMVRDLKSGATRELAPDWDRSAERIAFSDDGRTIVAAAEDLGQQRLFALDAETGGAPRVLTPEPGRASEFSLAGTTVVYAHDRLDSPSQLWRSDLRGGAARVLTRFNAELLSETPLGRFEQFSFPGWNGETVYGYVVKPADFQEGKTYPVAFLIHGGPQGSFGDLWHYRWNAQTYAGAGYAVVMIDFHGSTGYGQGFTDAISTHWGDRPLEDLQKGWAYALARYPFLDGGRACALGGSYGGYMINWIASQWKTPWRCLVNHDGLFDTRAMGASTEELWFAEWENGGSVFDTPAAYDRFNPALHVAQWSIPMLVIHGQNDFRVPLEQGLATFNALQRRGIESRFLYFPDENHWVLKPKNSVQWHDEVLAWLDRHTR